MKEKTANNVLLFPGIKKFTAIKKQDVDRNIEEVRSYHVQEVINVLIPQIFTQLNMAGFTPKTEEDEFSIKEGAFIVEAIRSHMYSHYGMNHPFQRIVDKVFIQDKEDEGTLIVAKSLKIILKD